MCGREELYIAVEDMRATFDLERWPLLVEPRFNIAPSYSTDDKWIIRTSPEDGAREMVPARWWLIPSWWKKPLNKLPTSFNARGEEVADKPMFRSAFAKKRCLVPATGWYEFQGKPGDKRSFHFSVADQKVFSFAGIYDEWVSAQDGQVVTSYSVITTEPNAQAAQIHDRMPRVLAPEDYASWLDPKNPKGAELIKHPYAGELVIYRASGVGNDSRVEGPEVAAPWVEPSARQGSLF